MRVQVRVQVQVQVLMSLFFLLGRKEQRGGAGTGTQQARDRHTQRLAECGCCWSSSPIRVAQRSSGGQELRGEERLVQKGLNRGLQVRGASRGSQMVSHKWFTATGRCMSGVRPVWVDWRCCAAGASSCRQARLVRLAQRCWESRSLLAAGEGGVWALGISRRGRSGCVDVE